jgi:hypothetical protein
MRSLMAMESRLVRARARVRARVRVRVRARVGVRVRVRVWGWGRGRGRVRVRVRDGHGEPPAELAAPAHPLLRRGHTLVPAVGATAQRALHADPTVDAVPRDGHDAGEGSW